MRQVQHSLRYFELKVRLHCRFQEAVYTTRRKRHSVDRENKCKNKTNWKEQILKKNHQNGMTA